ncbi:MAG: glycosyltransferase, partial [Gemmatimonadetes bacterium]|nr:glycosyltransferase [Gemmatimonadota bacterium]
VAARYGGPSVAVHAMARGVGALGAHVTVATTDADGAGRLPVPLDRAVEADGVEYRYFPRTLPGEWKLSLALSRWLHASVGRFDVVHVHALFSYATIPGCRAALRHGVPYLLRPLGTLDPWSLAQGAARKRPYLALVEGKHLRHAAAIHATSRAEAEGVAALGYGARVRVVPLGVELPEHVAGRRATPRLRILFLSRLHPKKGLPHLLDAVAELTRTGRADVELAVAGTGDAAYRRELEERVRALAIGGRVRFLGHLEGADKARALADADLFVLPSYQENFGIAVAEALAAGLPVVVSPEVAIAAEVAEAGAGLVADASSLSAAIERLAADPAERARMGARAAALARARYSWERTSRDLLALYEELARGVAQRHPPRPE